MAAVSGASAATAFRIRPLSRMSFSAVSVRPVHALPKTGFSRLPPVQKSRPRRSPPGRLDPLNAPLGNNAQTVRKLPEFKGEAARKSER